MNWVMIMLIAGFMLILSMVINKKGGPDREKNSPFECGFDPQNSSRMPFSLRFFIIALIFLIFDVEITLLLPMNMMKAISSANLICICSFVIILVLGVLYEWKEGALSWIK
uniref:NADH-ubiquinone oxidoreductase chain 3 n=1 Tax=Branchinecta paludosa TaxID=111186 RepID=A0A8K1I5V3_9CRUS|nr:NADH dehydrogenase subunit 3 [Branchinecta paludosa]